MEERGEKDRTKSQKPSERPLISVSVYSLEELEGALEGGADCVYFGEGLFRKPETAEKEKSFSKEGISGTDLDLIFESSVLKTRDAGRKIYFTTPKIVKDSEIKTVEELLSRAEKFGADGVIVSNLGTFSLAKEKGVPCVADSSLNIYNGYTFALLLENRAKMAVLSPELTLEEIKEVASKGPAECMCTAASN